MRVSIGDVAIWFDVDGVKLIAADDKLVERKTIVVLHGGPGYDHGYLKPELQALSEVAQVVFIDQRGQGRSDVGTSRSWTLDQWADDVVSFCDALDIKKPILLGTSFGGFVAFAAAARHPEFARGLVILASAAYSDREQTIARFGELGGHGAAQATRGFFAQPGDDNAFGAFFQACLPLYARKGFDPASLARCILRPELRVHFFRPGGEYGAFDYRAGLEACRAPTLMLHGRLDPVVPVAAAEATAAAFAPGTAKLIVYEDSAHDLIRDRWDDVLADTIRFVQHLP